MIEYDISLRDMTGGEVKFITVPLEPRNAGGSTSYYLYLTNGTWKAKTQMSSNYEQTIKAYADEYNVTLQEIMVMSQRLKWDLCITHYQMLQQWDIESCTFDNTYGIPDSQQQESWSSGTLTFATAFKNTRERMWEYCETRGFVKKGEVLIFTEESAVAEWFYDN